MDDRNVPRQLYPHTGLIYIGVLRPFKFWNPESPSEFFWIPYKKKKAVKIRVAININVCAII